MIYFILVSLLVCTARSFVIRNDVDPVLPSQKRIGLDIVIKIMHNHRTYVRCLEGTYFDKESQTCKFHAPVNISFQQDFGPKYTCKQWIDIDYFPAKANCR